MELNRIPPKGPPTAYRTFQITAPLTTHWRPATCAEVDCPNYVNGWRVQVESLTPELAHAARTSGRRYREEQIAAGETWLVFEAGQPCFRAGQHRARVGRPELYVVRNGDHRQYGKGRMHNRPEHWVEEFSENQQRIADAQQRG